MHSVKVCCCVVSEQTWMNGRPTLVFFELARWLLHSKAKQFLFILFPLFSPDKAWFHRLPIFQMQWNKTSFSHHATQRRVLLKKAWLHAPLICTALRSAYCLMHSVCEIVPLDVGVWTKKVEAMVMNDIFSSVLFTSGLKQDSMVHTNDETRKNTANTNTSKDHGHRHHLQHSSSLEESPLFIIKWSWQMQRRVIQN